MNFYAIVGDGKNTPLCIWNAEEEVESALIFDSRKMANKALAKCIEEFPEAKIIEVKIQQV